MPPQLPALKRKRDKDLIDDNKISKHIRVLLAIKAIEIEDNNDSKELITGLIPIPQIYKETINNPVYRPR